ncbi:MotA/TolQ/ExbB proton channel family protein [Stutzerimonas stutzeri]|uniref:MotA/TolQ/ExbB proton channel family protein n=1 Tax=Stutzerimonas stutzeri TaxID=316 RepID=UPI000F7BA515|nr:MotA/TolQ/ExbB proton channel family protein [Stutzerimonas stutzeri]MDI9738389.1 MotA/TolQ/ExbB proton channel family protein [Stutzerimonas stutzeri]RRW17030.1 MotA/TolQ/ExbB proton channel family protein [Stutzerimonas stutzeri]RSH67156.1 MotA/TolQ/ExbB proton channel family protein [Stutzerimonas stutzeri]
MNMDLLHDITFYIMYGAAALAAFVVIERAIFFGYTLRRARALEGALHRRVRSLDELPEAAQKRDSLPLQLVRQLLEGRGMAHSHQELEDLGQAIYISMRGKLVHGLWILETVVAGAPLLGLLGTILGIIDTFKALAEAGVSDPGEVSRGIGTALYATALGIAIALVGLVCNSHLQDRLELINDHLKMLLLRAGMGAVPAQGPVVAPHAALQASA